MCITITEWFTIVIYMYMLYLSVRALVTYITHAECKIKLKVESESKIVQSIKKKQFNNYNKR